MKKYFLYLIAVLFLTVSCKQKSDTETNIFIQLSRITDASNNKQVIAVGLKPAFLGKTFWNYIFKKYPTATSLIFSNDSARVWSVTKFSYWREKDIDTSKYYSSRVMDMALRAQVNSFLPVDPRLNEIDPASGKPGKLAVTAGIELNSAVRNDYNKLRHLLSDTSFPILILYVERETLNQVRSHKYVP